MSQLSLKKIKTIKFWEDNAAEFAGDTSSPEIIRLSGKYIGRKVLDAGAGSGALINKIPGAIGIDFVSKHKRMIRGSISNMPFKDISFDTIFATEILEHLDSETLNVGLDEIYRVLCRNGSLIITVPCREDLRRNMVHCPECGAKFHRWGHMQIFDEGKIKDTLESKGFAIVSIKTLPIGFMANHRLLKYLRIFFEWLKYIEPQNLFVVAVKR